jgi:hypothetical protein
MSDAKIPFLLGGEWMRGNMLAIIMNLSLEGDGIISFHISTEFHRKL